MNASVVIQAVINCNSAHLFLKWMNGFNLDFPDAIKLIHPDVCKDYQANDAFIKLIEFRKQLNAGIIHEDDSGSISYWNDRIEFNGDRTLLKYSFDCRTKLPRNQAFDKYLPSSMDATGFKAYFENRALPIAHLPNPLDQKHLNWIASRIFEFAAWLNSQDIVHAGINPDTIWVVPETHGIIVPTFYHMSQREKVLLTISAKWNRFYPEFVVRNKVASHALDVELIKRTMCWLAGDPSGIGNILKGKVNTEWLTFMTTFHDISAFEVFKIYRKLVDKNFPKAFHKLEI